MPCRDLTTIMVPLLQRLYATSARTPSALYMLLIVVLILSQDVAFAKAIHGIRIPSAPWFRERLLQNTTLGAPRCCCDACCRIPYVGLVVLG